MKISRKSVPPEYAELWAELVSANTTGSGAGKYARTRRGARRSKKSRRPIPISKKVDRIVASLARYHEEIGTPGIDAKWRHERRSELKAGVINPEWWRPAEVFESTVFESFPTSTPVVASSSYRYRRSDRKPSRPDYPDGTPSSAAPSYSGSLHGDVFTDDVWRWRRDLFIRNETCIEKCPDAVFLDIRGTLTVNASNRASRPMLSLATSLQNSPESTALAVDDPAPLVNCWKHYWRYDLPVVSPPYWHGSVQRRIMQALGGDRASKSNPLVVCRTAPSPMLGRGFNNNTYVNITWAGNAVLYEPVAPEPKGDWYYFVMDYGPYVHGKPKDYRHIYGFEENTNGMKLALRLGLNRYRERITNAFAWYYDGKVVITKWLGHVLERHGDYRYRLLHRIRWRVYNSPTWYQEFEDVTHHVTVQKWSVL